MKKILLGTTAVIALSAMSTQAFAAEKIKLGLGGFMRQYVGMINNDEVSASNGSVSRAMSFAQYSNTEIHVKGSTTLDNGLKVSAKVEFEADGRISGRSVDASYLTVSSDTMGALSMGSLTHASDQFRVGAPSVSAFGFDDFADWSSVATSASAASSGFTYSTGAFMTLGDGKGIKLVYVSPTLADMFTVYGSYSAGEGSDTANLRAVTRNATDDGYSFGVAFSKEVNGTQIDADLTRFDANGGAAVIGTGSTVTTSPAGGQSSSTADQFGLNVGMAGVTVGGSYTKLTDNRAGFNNNDGNAWELGVAYATGPYGVSARYTKSKTKGTAATAGDNQDTAWSVAASYDLGAGVALSAAYFDLEANPEGTVSKTTQVSGVIAGIEVGF